MLESGKGPSKEYAFLIAIPLQAHVDIEDVKAHLGDAVSWLEGCGKSEVESLGPLDVYTEQETI